MPEVLTCPYCNAQVPGPEVPRARIPCPRCGETFPYRLLTSEGIAAGPPPPSPLVDPAPSPSLLRATPAHRAVEIGILGGLFILISLILRAVSRDNGILMGVPFLFLLGGICLFASVWLWYFRERRSNQATGLFIVGNMVLVALLVLPYALLTVDFRRSRDPRGKEPEPESPAKDRAKTPPGGYAAAELPALGWLPADNNIVIGIHLADLRRDKAGEAFLKDPSWEPLREALTRVEHLTGLKPETIDHIALGAQLLPGLPVPLEFTAVVRTSEPYNPKSFGAVLAERKPMLHEGRLLYPLPFTGGGVWCADQRTLLVRVSLGSPFEQLKKTLPLTPRTGTEGLTAPLCEAIEKRLPRGTFVWMAGQSVPAEMLAAVLPFADGTKSTPAPLKGVKTFAVGLAFQPDVALIGDLECADPKAAAALQTFLEGQKVEGIGAPKVVRAPGGANITGAWVSFQLRANPDALRQALRTGGKLFPGVGQP
ncbi:MAG TPA: hypothetical protein VEL76_36405 [Gemmataceae bacterium]|nr:hypothetical protein [Gemmataceae bacterium]